MEKRSEHHSRRVRACLLPRFLLGVAGLVASVEGCREAVPHGVSGDATVGSAEPELDTAGAARRGLEHVPGVPRAFRARLTPDGLIVSGLLMPLEPPERAFFVHVDVEQVRLVAWGQEHRWDTSTDVALLLDELARDLPLDADADCVAFGPGAPSNLPSAWVLSTRSPWCLAVARPHWDLCERPDAWPDELWPIGQIDAGGRTLCERVTQARESAPTPGCLGADVRRCSEATPPDPPCRQIGAAVWDELRAELSAPLDESAVSFRYSGPLDGTMPRFMWVVRRCALRADGTGVCVDDGTDVRHDVEPSDRWTRAVTEAVAWARRLGPGSWICGADVAPTTANMAFIESGDVRAAVRLYAYPATDTLSPCSAAWVGELFDAFDVCWPLMARARVDDDAG